MGDYIPAVQVVAAFAVGLFLASAGWWATLKAAPRRCETCRPAGRGRHERPPELEPSADPPGQHTAGLRALPPLGDGGEWPPPWWEEPDEPLGRRDRGSP